MLTKLLAFGSAAAGTAAAASLTWIALSHTSQGSPGKRPRNQTPPAGAAVVCVAADSVLRAPATGDCPPGQVKWMLSTAELRDCSDCDPWTPSPARPPHGASPRLADLERRLAELENSPVFEVIDKRGIRVFTVAAGSVQVYDRSESPVAEIHATADGGFFAARTTDGVLDTFVGASAGRAGVRLTEGGVPRVDLGKQAAGNYSLTFPSDEGQVAAIGESRAGSGAVAVGGKTGRPKALMAAAEGKGSVNVFNGNGVPVLMLTEGDYHGGSFVIGDVTGDPVVKMNNNGRYGAVLTGPVVGFPLIQGSGLPGSYILGCAGGDACRQ